MKTGFSSLSALILATSFAASLALAADGASKGEARSERSWDTPTCTQTCERRSRDGHEGCTHLYRTEQKDCRARVDDAIGDCYKQCALETAIIEENRRQHPR